MVASQKTLLTDDIDAYEETLTAYRAAFGKCVDCAEKQIGLRLIRNALAIPEPDQAWPVESLPNLLAYAQERTKRRA